MLNLKKAISSLALAAIVASSAQAEYSPAGDRIKTRWAETIDVNNVWAEYPRPILQRDAWQNLNGLWNYAITPVGSAKPTTYEGEILVPFCIESSLSGVGKHVGVDNELWYNRSFTVPKSWKGSNVMLNFGAVDWRADVWVNGVKVGSHTGGYAAFSFDITPALVIGGNNTIDVCVYDGTDSGYQPRGKQVRNPGGVWYTEVTGIWQTVWLEPVAPVHVKQLKATADIDKHTIDFNVATTGCPMGTLAEVRVLDGNKVVASGKSINGEPIKVNMPTDAKLWSPDSPFLYDVKATLSVNGKQVDSVKSYVAMRKVSTKRDASGIMRLQLNNADIFHFGPLDQGWWPDGLYTAPSYEALIYDIDMTKKLGFNMIRKHIKVEPELWYSYCDKAGILVWQDMPSGDATPQWQMHKYFEGAEFERSPESEANYRKEWAEIVSQLSVHPCINMWVPFNEAWGQFKTQEIAKWTKEMDPTRLVNPASGGNFFTCGDVVDLHNYPEPKMYLYDAQRVTVLGEYGGIGLLIKGHSWDDERTWGYVKYTTEKEVTDAYVEYAQLLLDLVPRGFSAAVYTQTTDVEIEVNGLLTYDRKVVKLDESRVRAINQKLLHSLDKK
ncbi:MAG: glycoside hydrolase family 2 TIM barrel-domain containing protein [Bacteroidales bacterium]|nr:glycoside hydrolase family 2 TIM barrel-domain containing protein [Bacteroidales bacterium]